MSAPAGWFRVANDIGSSVKALELDHYLESLGLYFLTVGYCDRQRTDGFVPSRAFGRAIAPGCRTARLESDLVAAGLIEKTGDGYQVVDYLKWQRSRQEIEAAAEKASAAARARHSPSTTSSSASGSAQGTAERQDETDETSQRDEMEEMSESSERESGVEDHALRLINWVARTHGKVVSHEVAPIVLSTRMSHGHPFAAEAVERFTKAPAAVQKPVAFFKGIVKKMQEEGWRELRR
jgi:hypothetical protein